MVIFFNSSSTARSTSYAVDADSAGVVASIKGPVQEAPPKKWLLLCHQAMVGRVLICLKKPSCIEFIWVVIFFLETNTNSTPNMPFGHFPHIPRSIRRLCLQQRLPHGGLIKAMLRWKAVGHLPLWSTGKSLGNWATRNDDFNTSHYVALGCLRNIYILVYMYLYEFICTCANNWNRDLNIFKYHETVIWSIKNAFLVNQIFSLLSANVCPWKNWQPTKKNACWAWWRSMLITKQSANQWTY